MRHTRAGPASTGDPYGCKQRDRTSIVCCARSLQQRGVPGCRAQLGRQTRLACSRWQETHKALKLITKRSASGKCPDMVRCLSVLDGDGFKVASAYKGQTTESEKAGVDMKKSRVDGDRGKAIEREHATARAVAGRQALRAAPALTARLPAHTQLQPMGQFAQPVASYQPVGGLSPACNCQPAGTCFSEPPLLPGV